MVRMKALTLRLGIDLVERVLDDNAARLVLVTCLH